MTIRMGHLIGINIGVHLVIHKWVLCQMDRGLASILTVQSGNDLNVKKAKSDDVKKEGEKNAFCIRFITHRKDLRLFLDSFMQ